MKITNRFRLGVIAVLVDPVGRVLLCERADLPGAWQFPQGGIEAGESPQDTFFRELREEIGNNHCEIIRIGEGVTRYLWKQVGAEILGQEHHWILGRFLEGEVPNLAQADQSFKSYIWVEPGEALERAHPIKREAYRQGLGMLGLNLVLTKNESP